MPVPQLSLEIPQDTTINHRQAIPAGGFDTSRGGLGNV
jgi:hypothetical protein